MNCHNPGRENYNRNRTLSMLRYHLAEAIEAFFEDEDEGKISHESVTILVNGQVFTFPMEAELTSALFEFIDNELKEVQNEP